jgi:polar amino acid transport system substrate-binding protein
VGTVFLDMLNKKGIFKEVRSYDSVADMRATWPGPHQGRSGRPAHHGLPDAPEQLPGVKLADSYKPVNMGDVCLVVRKGDTETLNRLNKAIAAIKADGTLAKIIQKWGI